MPIAAMTSPTPAIGVAELGPVAGRVGCSTVVVGPAGVVVFDGGAVVELGGATSVVDAGFWVVVGAASKATETFTRSEPGVQAGAPGYGGQ
ncbi:MAG: hypothetical protein AB7R77_12760 [Ilumatobacteraceae bacterium]